MSRALADGEYQQVMSNHPLSGNDAPVTGDLTGAATETGAGNCLLGQIIGRPDRKLT